MRFFYALLGLVALTTLQTSCAQCSNGIDGVQYEDSVCCEAQCGACGGTGCVARPGGKDACCSGDIVASGVMCSTTSAAPCIIDPGSADQTSPKGSLSRPDARTKPNSIGSEECNPLAMATGVVDDKLKQLGIMLPEAASAGKFVLYRRSADTLYMSGHLPKAPDGTLTTGKVGEDVNVEQAAAAARLVAVNLITTMKAAVGDLDKIRLVKITGFIRSSDGFAGQSQVLNGASDLFVEAFGREKGEHARSAIGVNALPFGVCVEIEAIAEVAP